MHLQRAEDGQMAQDLHLLQGMGGGKPREVNVPLCIQGGAKAKGNY